MPLLWGVPLVVLACGLIGTIVAAQRLRTEIDAAIDSLDDLRVAITPAARRVQAEADLARGGMSDLQRRWRTRGRPGLTEP